MFIKPDELSCPLRILIWGRDGTAKTPTALYFAQHYGPAAAIDADGGLEVYPASEHNYRLLRTEDPVLVRNQIRAISESPKIDGTDETFKLLIIDPITTIDNKLQSMVEERERARIDASGAESSEFTNNLNKGSWRPIKRLHREIMSEVASLGMPVICTAREANLWENDRITGIRPDCDKDTPHDFDVVIRLAKITDQGPRRATVSRDRFRVMKKCYEANIDDVLFLARAIEEAFPKAWGLQPIVKERLSGDQLVRIKALCEQCRVPWGQVIERVKHYGADSVEDLSPSAAGQIIDKLELRHAENLKRAGLTETNAATIGG